jgi:hypothetical protein
LKKYCSLIHGQPVLEATLDLKRSYGLVKEHLGYEGGLDQPVSWDRVVEKFHWLSEAFAEADLRDRLIQTVQQLDLRPISDLTVPARPGSPYSGLSKNSSRHSVIVPGHRENSCHPLKKDGPRAWRSFPRSRCL